MRDGRIESVREQGPGPLGPTGRVVGLDVLRGVAVLGILLMNIRSFALPEAEAGAVEPTWAGPLGAADAAAWWATSALAEGKFLALFAMMFGAGIVLVSDRRKAVGRGSAALHYRRMGWLFAIGLVHAYGIWFGDILATYAMCGCLVWLMRGWPAGRLLGVGLGMVAVGSGVSVLIGWSAQFWPADLREEMFGYDPEWTASELAAYRGGWWEQMGFRAPAALTVQTLLFVAFGLWHAGGLMLIGMALVRWGLLRGAWSGRRCAAAAAAGVGVGLPVTLWGLWLFPPGERVSPEALFLGLQFTLWGSVPMAVGYAAGVMGLAGRRELLSRWMRPLAAVGRTALSNYLGQSVVCTLLFYGTVHDLEWFGRVGYAAQLGVVMGVWALQLGVSWWWTRRYRMGPMEWLWRWGGYGSRPAWRRGFRGGGGTG
ncbi:MAG: DUF418 domain-containing protein [Planctomycetota bacterium]